MKKAHKTGPADLGEKIGWSAFGQLTLFMAGFAMSFQVVAEDSSFTYTQIPAVDCVVNPNKVVDLASPVPGVIDTLLVERSQQVTAGQVVAQLDAGVERANVKLAHYRAGTQSEISIGETNLTYDNRRLSRLDALYQKEVISADVTEEAEREAKLSRLEVKQAEELAVVRKLELQRASEQLRQKSIRAPFDGFVLDTYKYKGEYVEDQAILRLAQFDPLVIEAIVPMDNFGKIEPGMMAEIVPEFDSAESLTGEVTIVDRMGDTASNTFGVRMVMPNPDNRIPAGLKCVAKFLDPSVHRAPAVATELENNVAAPETTTEEVNAIEDADELHPGVMLASASPDLFIDAMPPISKVNDDEKQDAQKQKAEPVGYTVATPQGETDQHTLDLVSRLREAGIRDLYHAKHGQYEGMVLLGYYKSQRNALKRQTELAELGFKTDIHERY